MYELNCDSQSVPNMTTFQTIQTDIPSVIMRNHLRVSELSKTRIREEGSIEKNNYDDYEFLRMLFPGQPELSSLAAGTQRHTHLASLSGATSRNPYLSSFSGPTYLADDPIIPKFEFPVSEVDFQLKDQEELRVDRATKVTKKEMSELAERILNVTGTLNSDVDSRGIQNSDQTPASSNQTVGEAIPLTEKQVEELRMQVQQHKQQVINLMLAINVNEARKEFDPGLFGNRI